MEILLFRLKLGTFKSCAVFSLTAMGTVSTVKYSFTDVIYKNELLGVGRRKDASAAKSTRCLSLVPGTCLGGSQLIVAQLQGPHVLCWPFVLMYTQTGVHIMKSKSVP